MDRLGPMLADARRRTGLTQRAVEAETGISNAYLSQLEGGKVRQPSPTILHKLAELYAVDYATVLGWAGYPVPSTSEQSTPSGLAARIGPTTEDEEEALAEYLEFLRSKTRKGPTR
jgi:transcriptional regulator with XRE-family HTH domain